MMFSRSIPSSVLALAEPTRDPGVWNRGRSRHGAASGPLGSRCARTIAALSFAWAALATPVLAQDPPAAAEPEAVTKIREMVPGIITKLEAMRGQKFARPVEVRYQSPEGFRAFMQKSLDEEYPPEKARNDQKLLAAIGLIAPDLDLRQTMVDAMASQALAYYDPEQGTFFVLQADMPADQVAATVLHELQHALQDQRFDLKAKQAPFKDPAFDRSDVSGAMRFMVEGEATLLQTRYMLEQMKQEALLELALRMEAETPRRQAEAMQLQQVRQLGEQGKSMVAALEAQAKLPGFIYHSLVDAYKRGAALVHAVYKRGGWEAVDALFKQLPTSTEQVLHPEKVGPGETRDEPTTFELPEVAAQLGEGWTKLGRDTLGELDLRILFENLTGQEKPRAAAGWDGDRIVCYGKGEDVAFTWHLVWDTPADATEFVTELRKALGTAPASLKNADITVKDASVTIIGGCPQDKLEAVRKAVTEGVPTAAAAAPSTPAPPAAH